MRPSSRATEAPSFRAGSIPSPRNRVKRQVRPRRDNRDRPGFPQQLFPWCRARRPTNGGMVGSVGPWTFETIAPRLGPARTLGSACPYSPSGTARPSGRGWAWPTIERMTIELIHHRRRAGACVLADLQPRQVGRGDRAACSPGSLPAPDPSSESNISWYGGPPARKIMMTDLFERARRSRPSALRPEDLRHRQPAQCNARPSRRKSGRKRRRRNGPCGLPVMVSIGPRLSVPRPSGKFYDD